MSTKKKLIISLCSLCLVAAVVVIGVFAFASQTLTITNKVSFTASSQVQATITLTGTNNGTAIADLDEDTSGNQGTLTWTYSGEEGKNLNKDVTLADQTFTANEPTGSETDATVGDIVYTYKFKCNGPSITVTFSSDTTFPTSDGIDRDVAYAISTDDTTYTTSSNGATVAKDSYFKVTITYSLDSILTSASLTDSYSFALAVSAT